MTQLASKTVGRSSGGRSRALDVDHYVSLRIRQRRIMLGLTQQQMAELIGVTYQQAHKYERGLNRISAGRLYEIAQVLSALDDTAPEIRRMSGSGATCFALYRSHDVMRKAAEKLALAHPGWWQMQGNLR